MALLSGKPSFQELVPLNSLLTSLQLAFVFKYGSDALFLEDFKRLLDQLTDHSLGR